MFDIYDETPIGIDLGTTNSCIGYWNGKEVKIIPNRIGEKTTPSIIYFLNNQKEYLVGEQSQKYLSLECQKIYSIKRIIGRDFNEKNLENEISLLNYKIIKDKVTNKPLITIIQNSEESNYTPEYLSSLILKKLVNDAENLLLKPIKNVVITVPAYFDDAQRNATIEAARLAGLKVLRIINEPTAAALSYGLGQNFCPFKKESQSFSALFKQNRELRKINKIRSFCLFPPNGNTYYNQKDNNHNNNNNINEYYEKGKNIMVFDLGGGTFDLAILQLNLEEKEYEVKSKFSNKYLGGDDFNDRLVEFCLKKNGYERNLLQKEKKSLERLRNACEQAKKILSYRDEADIIVHSFFNEKDLITKITKEEFEEKICKDLFDKLSIPFEELIKGANLTKENIDEIILVGGSTKMPYIKEMLKSKFNCKINDSINPDEVVAFGATIQAAMLMTVGKNKILKGVKLFDITPISLGTDVVNKSSDPKIRALGNKMSIIIPKWKKIPIKKQKKYKTINDYQETMQICIFEGENDYLKDNKLLGKFILQNLPQRPKGEVEIVVTFEIDANNILKVTAVETSKGVNKNIEVRALQIEKPKIKTIGSLTMSQLDQEKRKVYYNIEQYINNYINNNDINSKITILENYNQIIESEIKEINGKEDESGINGNNIEKYFFYVFQLFESYEEMLNLEMDENIRRNKVEYIKDNIIKYINIFKRQNIYYIKQFIDLFKDVDKNIFLQIFYQSIKNFNEMGQDYLKNLKKFSKYYAKLYFEEVMNLSKQYKILENEGLYNCIIMSQVKEEINKSEIELSYINSNAISLINESKKEKKLIDVNSEIGSGFTFIKKKLNAWNNENTSLNNDDYNLILDELEKILSELDLLIKKSQGNKEINVDLLEQQGICLGSIVKIKFSLLNGKNYREYLMLIDRCIFNAKRCGKDNLSTKWFQDVKSLKEEIENKKNNFDKELSTDIKEEIKDMDKKFNQNDKMIFINYILERWPYDGYNNQTRPSFYDWDTINRELISFLWRKYHPDSYPQNTQEEKYKYKIMECISQRLNNILEEMTPENDEISGERKYLLK